MCLVSSLHRPERLPGPPSTRPADVSVKFRITLSEAKMREALAAGLLDKFKLKSKISTGGQAGAGRAVHGAGWAGRGIRVGCMHGAVDTQTLPQPRSPTLLPTQAT